jgi:hypothetical protein
MNILSDNKSYPFEYSIKIFWKSLPWGNKIDLIRDEIKLLEGTRVIFCHNLIYTHFSTLHECVIFIQKTRIFLCFSNSANLATKKILHRPLII